jgi:Flp pilus assembly protein TadD
LLLSRLPFSTELQAQSAPMPGGLDEFVAEQEHDRIAPILSRWCATRLDEAAIREVLAEDFLGFSVQSGTPRIVRSGAQLEVRKVAFDPRASLSSTAFLDQFRASYPGLVRVELQVTRVRDLQSRVRYELVGTGPGFHREQRTGYWDLEWTAENRLRRWSGSEETRARSTAPCFTDIADGAFPHSEQLLQGVDHWRAVLDGACGIDIYGHNGVSLGDIDGDGFDDVYVCQPAGLPNRLYRNRGDGTFEDITAESGVGLLENTACALFIDFDNEGRQDLVVVRATGPLLFLNQGGGKFQLKPRAFQFATPPQGTFTGAAAADYDRDGWLDIYFCLYTYYQGTNQYKYPAPYYAAENGPPNFLMRNNRDGTFRDVTVETGLHRNNTRYSFCCGWSDYNRDGWPDLYVVNDFGRKNLYRNNGDGTFTDVAAQAGVEDVGAGMGVCWLDYNKDGAQDLYVANMWTAAGERISRDPAFQKNASPEMLTAYRKHAMGNSLFRNTGDGVFQDATVPSGVGMGRWSWSSDAWDFDHDGYPDLYIANGMLSGPIREDLNSFFWRQVVAKSPVDAKPSPAYEQGWGTINELIRAGYTWSGYERNVFYANNRDGTFSDVSAALGLDFIDDSRAFALADFDGDGRLEALLKNRTGPQLRLLKNEIAALPPSISFRLRGTKSNRDAIGAAVTVQGQTRMVQAGSGFLSQHSKDVFFGLGDAQGPVQASIRWPSGLVQQLHDLPANHRVWIEERSATPRIEPFRAPQRFPARPPAPEISTGTVETWLLVPVAAPDHMDHMGRRRVVTFDADHKVDPAFNILYRYLFDWHRDITVPTSFLIDDNGMIVKIYQGPVSAARLEQDFRQIPRTAEERIAKALPFAGVSATYDYGRNNLSLGSVFFQRENFEQSERYFELALRDDPTSAEAYYGLGSVYLKKNRAQEARASFEKAVKLTAAYPDTRPNAWNNLGLLDTREGRTADAIACFDEALKISPDHPIALLNLGNAYRVEKRWEDARRVLEHALAVKPQDPEANYALAMVFAQTGETGHAYESLQKALQLRPGYPEALNNLAILYLRTQRRDLAVAKFEECIRVAPAFDQAYLNLARVYTIEGTPEKARVILQDLLKQHPGHAQALAALDQLKE